MPTLKIPMAVPLACGGKASPIIEAAKGVLAAQQRACVARKSATCQKVVLKPTRNTAVDQRASARARTLTRLKRSAMSDMATPLQVKTTAKRGPARRPNCEGRMNGGGDTVRVKRSIWSNVKTAVHAARRRSGGVE